MACIGPGDVALTMADIRVVTRFAAGCAAGVLPLFDVPGDDRPRAALDAALDFAGGAERSRRQRVTAVGAARAGRAAPSGPARHAALAAADAAASAYLHPLARATQVGHVLRAAAHAAYAVELADGGGPETGDAALERARLRAGPDLVAVLVRYPRAPQGRSRVARLMSDLDDALRRTAPAD
ncbi:putative immunity protein [Pseudonocardia spirodelae]|uniref:Immunity protein n=1 Tax=Pseudonocardia spirodelae TaxID=3133431 RepID=A0ABU8T9Z0_9PSEU